jgi:hypothetical protein
MDKNIKTINEKCIQSFNDRKKIFNIGIFGSFYGRHLSELCSLRDFLRKNGYDNAKISYDLEEQYPRQKGERIQKYNKRVSKLLVETSHFHIFLFFAEKDDEHYINNSALCEVSAADCLDKELVVIYIENKAKRKLGAYFEGFPDEHLGSWQIDHFTKVEEIYNPALFFCMNCVKSMP